MTFNGAADHSAKVSCNLFILTVSNADEFKGLRDQDCSTMRMKMAGPPSVHTSMVHSTQE